MKIHRNGQRLPSSLACSAEGSRNSWPLVARTLHKPVWIKGGGVVEAEWGGYAGQKSSPTNLSEGRESRRKMPLLRGSPGRISGCRRSRRKIVLHDLEKLFVENPISSSSVFFSLGVEKETSPESWQMENWEIGIAIPFPPRLESGPCCDHTSPERARTGPPIKARCNSSSWSSQTRVSDSSEIPRRRLFEAAGPQIPSTAVGRDGR